ncbi:multidrug effflux MFS transporter [Denitrobaculum tricleocarpae]|uniref:Bcr/CflA family efflux transporter n=1 Tax=Denitrobaculum tricleocarpae TaxID=2591009 RepID=A0A545U1A9_9PROT|nr:multidrug effflux MFS transporter [Denitrobaculum tricleocarpae]TQV83269.1 multidrug effflux MFS transporter [Denitrobaculum tricleocarpae]
MSGSRPGAPQFDRFTALMIPVVLISASFCSVLSTDLYLPSLPSLPDYFSTNAQSVQLTMSLNLAGFALAQLIHGPLSDRFGRRPILLIGMIGFLLTTLACAGAQSIGQLVTARAMQGAAASAEAVLILAVIRDLYDDTKAAKMLGVYGMSISVAPAIGPLIGGYIFVWFGWRANFLLLSILIALITFLIWRYLSETTTPDRNALRPSRLFYGYLGLLRKPDYMIYVVVLALSLGGLFAFIAAAPFVLIDRLGVKPQNYGYYQAIVVGAYFVGNLIANRIVEKIPSEWLLRASLVLMALGGGLLPLLLQANLETPLALAGAMSFFGLGLAFIFVTAPVRALAAAGTGVGLASALLSAIQMGGAALGAAAINAFYDGSAYPMAITVAACGVASLVIYEVWRLRN